MDEDGVLEMRHDHNHNYREDHGNIYYLNCISPMLSKVSCITVADGVCDGGITHPDSASDSEAYCYSPPNVRGQSPNPSEFMINAMTAENYKETYWPRLEKAVEQLLTQSPVKYSCISFEQIYSYVYKCVCQQYSEHLYRDLIWKITSHLQQVCLELQDSRPECFVENFNLVFTQYMGAIQCIIPVFIYMNKFYIETKLNRDLKDDLMDLFSAYVAGKHISTLITLLKKADAMPFQVKPSTMASVVKGLYDLQPEWAQLAPALFSRFIPRIHPPVLESDLLRYAAQDQKLQMELSLNSFSRCDQSRKRASEES